MTQPSILKRAITQVSLFVSCLFLISCSTAIEEYDNSSPPLTLESYFNGDLVAWGMVQDYSDKVTRRFCVEMTGSWQDSQNGLVGTLDEDFYYADGEQGKRIWTLEKVSDNQYTGTAQDVTGIATGEINGFAFQWDYTLNVTIDGTSMSFVLDDWMYQIDQYRLMNRTTMRKFGIPVAEITIFFDKEQPLRNCSELKQS